MVEAPRTITTDVKAAFRVQETVEASRAGDTLAKNHLARNLFNRLYKYYLPGFPDLAEDLAQVATMKIITNIETFDQEHGRGSYTQNFWGWSFTIARNVLTDYTRRQKLELLLINENQKAPDSDTDSKVVDISREEFTERLKRWIMENLKQEEMRRAVTYLAADGLKNSEISQRMGIPPESVKVHLCYGRKKVEDGFLHSLGLKRTSSNRDNLRRLDLAARSNQLPAIKIMNFWYSTEDAITDYLNKHPQKQQEEWGDLLPAYQNLTNAEYYLLYKALD